MLVLLSLIFGGILVEGLFGDTYNYQQVLRAHHPDSFGFPTNYEPTQTSTIILNLETDVADLDDDSGNFDNAEEMEEASFSVPSITPDKTLYDTNRIKMSPTFINFMPDPWIYDKQYYNNFYQNYVLVSQACDTRENSNECLNDCDASAASPCSFSDLEFASRQQTPLVPSTNENQHLDFYSQDINQKPILHAEIDQQTAFEPTTHFNSLQRIQITGDSDAVSQSQSLRNVQTIVDQQKIQSTQMFGQQDSVSQSQSSNEQFSTSPDSLVGAPHIFRVPRNRQFYRISVRMKRSLDDQRHDAKQLKNQIDVLKDMKTIADNQRYLLFITDLENNLLDELQAINSTRLERQVPILRLLVDPNAKIDVPKTLDSMGTVVRNSFEKQQAPLYHVRNMLSSVKDAFMSTLKIPADNPIIPSEYKIVSKNNENCASGALLTEGTKDTLRTEEQTATFLDTYEKLGNMLRESVISGREALSHMSDAAYNAKKALHSSRSFAPKIAATSLRIPKVEHVRNTDNKFSKTSLTHNTEVVGEPYDLRANSNILPVGHVLDAFAISNPKPQNNFKDKIFHPRDLILGKYIVLADDVPPKIGETLSELDNAKGAVGANSLKEFILNMRSNLPNEFKTKLEEARARLKVRPSSKMNELRKVLDNQSRTNNLSCPFQRCQLSTVVPALSTPNVKIALKSSQQDLTYPSSSSGFIRPEEVQVDNQFKPKDIRGNENVEVPLGAINPIMYQKMFNERLEVAKPIDLTKIMPHESFTNNSNTREVYVLSNPANDPSFNGTGEGNLLGTSMVMWKALLTPFLGKIKQKVVDVYSDEGYNNYYEQGPGFYKDPYTGAPHKTGLDITYKPIDVKPEKKCYKQRTI